MGKVISFTHFFVSIVFNQRFSFLSNHILSALISFAPKFMAEKLYWCGNVKSLLYLLLHLHVLFYFIKIELFIHTFGVSVDDDLVQRVGVGKQENRVVSYIVFVNNAFLVGGMGERYALETVAK